MTKKRVAYTRSVFRVVGGAILGAATGLAAATFVALAGAKMAASGGNPVHDYDWPAWVALLLIGAGTLAGVLYALRTDPRRRRKLRPRDSATAA